MHGGMPLPRECMTETSNARGFAYQILTIFRQLLCQEGSCPIQHKVQEAEGNDKD